MKRVAAGLVAALTGAACGLPETGPIALDDRFEAAPGATLTLDVLANDRPPAGEQLVLIAVTGGRGEVDVDGGSVRYRAPDDEGLDTFSYETSTADGSSATAEVVVAVGATSTSTTTEVPASSTSVGRRPRVEPSTLDFGVVAEGAVARRSVTVVAGDEAWTPDWAAVGTGSAAELEVVGSCPRLSPRQPCTVELVWAARSPLDTTVRPHDEVPFRVRGDVAPIEVDPAQQTTRARVGERSVTVAFGVVAPSVDPVEIDIEVTDGPPGTEVVQACALLEGRCDVVVRVPVDAPGERPPVIVTVTTPGDRLEARIDVVGELPQPEWLVPAAGDELWVGLVERGMTVQHGPVEGAEEVVVDAFLCADDACGIELVTDRLGGSPEVVVVAPRDLDVFAWYRTTVAAGIEPRLLLQAVARVGDVTSAPSTREVPLVEEPFVASWLSFDPPDALGGCVTLTATMSVGSRLLEPTSVLARFIGDEPDSGEEKFSDPVVVSAGPNRIEGTVLLDFPLEGIELVTTEPGLPAVPVVGVPEYVARSCID